MRFVFGLLAISLAVAPAASATSYKILDVQQIAALEARAEQAAPKEQCFLYAELAYSLSQLASQQLIAGDSESASVSLKAVGRYTQKIHTGANDDAKKLKNAEILMRQTAFRVKELMMSASLDDRPGLESTLKQLEQVQSEMMLAVFKH
jgi:hypothetical protein